MSNRTPRYALPLPRRVRTREPPIRRLGCVVDEVAGLDAEFAGELSEGGNMRLICACLHRVGWEAGLMA
jgi:hypothetical protein